MLSRKETVRITNTKHRSIFDPDTLRKERTMETHHWSHVTRWWINGDDLEAKDARHYAPKTTWSRSLTSSSKFTRRYCSHQCPARPQKQIAAYFWIFKSSTKFPFQRIKNQVKSEIPTSGYGQNIEGCALWKFLDSTQRQKWNGHNFLVWTRLKMNDHSLER